MDRRSFLATTAAGAAATAFPAVLRAQGKDPIRIGFPLPLTGPFGALAADQQRGAMLGADELNAKGGILGRKVEVLFRDDQLKPAVGAQRTKISAKPDTSPITFHEALNPTITSRAVGGWIADNLGKKWWIIYADYAWGKQNNAVLQDVLKKKGGAVLGATPYPLGSAEFSAHLPKIQAAKPEVQKKFNMPPGDYGCYAYSGVMEVARGCEVAKSTDSEAVAKALRANPVYDHYKGKQWWRACDNKSFQDLWIVKGRDKAKGDWGLVEVVSRVPANEELDRTCAEKGLA